MKKQFCKFIPALFVLGIANAAEWQYLQPSQTDMTSASLTVAAFAEPTANTNRDPVSFAWALDRQVPLNFEQPSYTQRSRSYWMDVDAAALSKGIGLPLTASGAVIRISPRSPVDALNEQSAAKPQKGFASIDIGSLQLRQGDQQRVGRAAIETLANAEQLSAAGMDVADQTVAFKVDSAFTAGELELRINVLSSASENYVVHVFEPNSTAVLELQAGRSRLLTGEQGRVGLSGDGIDPIRAGEMSGYLMSPDGRTTVALTFVDTSMGVEAVFDTSGLTSPATGLWEVQTFLQRADGQRRLLRDARTAIAISAPTARLTGQATELSSGGFKIGVDAAAEGRYEIRAVLFGSEASGSLVPALVLHGANWLSGGAGTVSLEFDRQVLEAAGLRQPFELRHLELKDQSRMGDLWRQEFAFRAVADRSPGLRSMDRLIEP